MILTLEGSNAVMIMLELLDNIKLLGSPRLVILMHQLVEAKDSKSLPQIGLTRLYYIMKVIVCYNLLAFLSKIAINNESFCQIGLDENGILQD